MHTKLLARFALATTVAIFCLGVVQRDVASNPIDPEAEARGPVDVAGLLGTESWPIAVSEVYGYNWSLGDYGLLAGFSVTSDSQSAHSLYWRSGESYGMFVQRELSVDSSGTRVALTITCCRNYAAAKASVHRRYNANAGPQDNLGYGPWFGVSIGDAAVLKDCPFVNRSTFDGTTSKRLLFVRGNLIVDVFVDGAGVSAVDLAQEMDAQILMQHQTSGGNPTVPTVEVELDSDQVDFSGLTPPERSWSTPMSVSASIQGGGVTTRVFMSHENKPFIMDADGFTSPDPDRPPYYDIFDGKAETMLDSVINPTTLTVTLGDDIGNWHVVAVAWGDNLLPAYAVAPFTN